jgi:hypothetical protein
LFDLRKGRLKDPDMNRFATYLDTLPNERQVEIVHELIQLGAARSAPGGNAGLDSAIRNLRPAEYETLSVLVDHRQYLVNSYEFEDLTLKVMEFILIHPLDSKSKLLRQSFSPHA